jgi:putative hemolysin
MTPRHDVEMLDADASLGEVLDELLKSGFSRFPGLCRIALINIIGLAHVRDHADALSQGR